MEQRIRYEEYEGRVARLLQWNPAKLEQRIARAWRKRQKRSVQVINLICENSIEHRMLYLLEQTFNQPMNVLHEQDATLIKKRHRQKQVQQATHYLNQAEHKQRMAHLLMEGDFTNEAVPRCEKRLPTVSRRFCI